MRLRGDNWNNENVPTSCGLQAPKVNGQKRTAQTRLGKAVPAASRAHSPSAGERAVLREKTNLEPQRRARTLRGKEGGAEVRSTVWAESAGLEKSPQKESRGVKSVTKKIQRGRGAAKASAQLVVNGPRDENNSLVRRKRRGSCAALPKQEGSEPRDENNSVVTRRRGGSFIASPKQAGDEPRDENNSSVTRRGGGSLITSPKQAGDEPRDENNSVVTRRRGGSFIASPKQAGDEPRDENNSSVTRRGGGSLIASPKQAGDEPRDENNSVVTRRRGGSFIASPKQSGDEARDKEGNLVAGRKKNGFTSAPNKVGGEVTGKKDILVTRKGRGKCVASPKQVEAEANDKSDSLDTRRREDLKSPRQAGDEPSDKRDSWVTGWRQSSLVASTKEAGGRSTDKKDSLANRRRGSFKSPKLAGGELNDGNNSSAAERRRCVYMNVVSEPCKVSLPNKESIYEFEVDGNEPPSRRRRRRARGPTTSKNKKRVFPKFPRVRFPSRSETTASSVESVATLSSFGLGSTTSERTVPEAETPSSVVASISKPTFALPSAVSIPRLDMKLRKRLSTVLESPRDASVNSPCPCVPTDNVVGADLNGDSRLPTGEAAVSSSETTPSKIPRTTPPAALHGNTDPCGHSRLLGDQAALACRETTPSKIPRAPLSALHGNSCWQEEPSLGTSSVLSNVNLSFAHGFAHLHSTPVKARSGSDSSSNFTQLQVDATADNCFGFSSDDDEECNDRGLPSPLYASPHTHAMRQALLTSSPPSMAPSRFAPEVVRRALVLEAVSRPLQFDGGRHRGRLSGTTFVGGKKRRGGGQRRQKKVTKELGQGIDEYLLKRQGVDPVLPLENKGQDEPPAPGTTTPPSGSLFGDAKDEAVVEEDVPAPLSVRPPRRSYERPWNRKLKKVIGGGLCLDSSDEDNEGGEEEGPEVREEERVVEEEAPPPEMPKAPKVVARHRTTAAENKENQLNKWASQINSQFDEVEDFELCVG